ncbi:MAG: hypothetical protein CMM73_04140 [Rhodospirillaceae bacterium]|nr:hypothetical protein [Rhodospirillaceae bacterium]
MNVLFPFRGNTVGGSHISSMELIKELSKLGINTEIAIHEKGPVVELLMENNIPFEMINHKFLEAPGGLTAIVQLPRIKPLVGFLKTRQIDIVHTNDGVMTHNWVPAARLAKKKSVVHVRRLWQPSRISDWLHLYGDHFIANSNFVRSSIPQKALGRVTTVANPIMQPIVSKANANRGKEIIVMVGSHTVQKRPEIFIEAARVVSMERPEAQFILIGRHTQYTAHLRELVNKAGLNANFDFIEYTTKVANIIDGATLLVAPALNEGHGRTLIEAMLLSTPVIASRSGGHAEIIEDGVNGKMFEPDNSAAMAETIIDLLSDLEKIKTMVDVAKKFAVKNFAADVHARAILKTYMDLVKE